MNLIYEMHYFVKEENIIHRVMNNYFDNQIDLELYIYQ